MSKETFGIEGSAGKAGRFLTRSTRANGLVFTTLHHGFDPADYDPSTESGTLPDELGTQTRFVLEELAKVLDEAGSALERTLRFSFFVNAPSDAVGEVEDAYRAFCRARGLRLPPPHETILGELVDSGIAADAIALVEAGPDGSSELGGFVLLPWQSGEGAGMAEQTGSCLAKLEALLAARGLGLDRLVKVRVLLAQIGQKHGIYNPAYNDYFHSRGILRKPARSTLGVELEPGELVRMEAIAYV